MNASRWPRRTDKVRRQESPSHTLWRAGGVSPLILHSIRGLTPPRSPVRFFHAGVIGVYGKYARPSLRINRNVSGW